MRNVEDRSIASIALLSSGTAPQREPPAHDRRKTDGEECSRIQRGAASGWQVDHWTPGRTLVLALARCSKMSGKCLLKHEIFKCNYGN